MPLYAAIRFSKVRKKLYVIFPKGRSLDDVTDEEVREAYDSLNHRPRKRLAWRCPCEVYFHRSLHLL